MLLCVLLEESDLNQKSLQKYLFHQHMPRYAIFRRLNIDHGCGLTSGRISITVCKISVCFHLVFLCFFLYCFLFVCFFCCCFLHCSSVVNTEYTAIMYIVSAEDLEREGSFRSFFLSRVLIIIIIIRCHAL